MGISFPRHFVGISFLLNGIGMKFRHNDVGILFPCFGVETAMHENRKSLNFLSLLWEFCSLKSHGNLTDLTSYFPAHKYSYLESKFNLIPIVLLYLISTELIDNCQFLPYFSHTLCLGLGVKLL